MSQGVSELGAGTNLSPNAVRHRACKEAVDIVKPLWPQGLDNVYGFFVSALPDTNTCPNSIMCCDTFAFSTIVMIGIFQGNVLITWENGMQRPQHEHGVNDAAIAKLYQRHAPALFTYLRLHTPAREDAEDMLVEVFLAALEQEYVRELSDEEQRLWLWRVAHNRVADHYRRTARHQVLPLDDVAETAFEDEALAPEQVSLRGEEHDRLHASVQCLSELQQLVLRLRFVNGLHCGEIAKLVGKREGAVRMLLTRTLNLLRTIYENY